MDKKIVLYQNFYVDSDLNRQKEIDECLRKNIQCEFIDAIILIHNPEFDIDYIIKNKFDTTKIFFLEYENRPTYNDFLKLMKQNIEYEINILANIDIYFNDTLRMVKEYEFQKDECLALSRWDKLTDGSIIPFCHIDTQDVWIFPNPLPQINGADFTLGLPGCDNKIAFLLRQNGYKVYNPSIDIKCVHLHLTEKRNYNRETDTVPPPYAMVQPITMKQIPEYASQS